MDNLRQRNMLIALAIFALLFGFGLKSDSMLVALFTALALTILMTVLYLLDRKLHRMSHG